MDNIIEYLHTISLKSNGISIDTRTIGKGNLFFALRGPNFDANQYASEALQKGASFVVVDDPKYATNDQIISVPDTLQALQELAIFHRRKSKAKVLALTGSNGKTTTKELIVRILSKKFVTLGTKGNLNNHIGVPLTLLSLVPDTEMAVIEMGANKVGDIAELCGFAEPSFGLITNIGEAHTEGFGGIEGVIRGKSELFDHLRKTAGIPFINMDDPVLGNMTKRFEKFVQYPDPDVVLLNSQPTIRFRLGTDTIVTHFIGAYNFQNIAASIAVGRNFGVEDKSIGEAISSYIPSNQRSQVIEKGPLKIIMDAYNANPTSMKAALESLGHLPGQKHVILGDMKELEKPADAHSLLGKALAEMDLENVLLVGPEMKFAADQVKKAQWFKDSETLNIHLAAHPLKQGHVLIKGSRSMHLEKVLEAL